MNLKLFLLLFTFTGSWVAGAAVPAPPSLEGAIIYIEQQIFYPGVDQIELYTPKGNKASVIIHREQYFGSQNSFGRTLGGKPTRGNDNPPAIITFEKREGRVYTGKISGKCSSLHLYHGEEEENVLNLNNKTIEIVMPEEHVPQPTAIDAPEELPDGTLIQILTDKRLLEYKIGEKPGCVMLTHYIARKSTATIDINLPNVFEVLSITDCYHLALTMDAYHPRLIFTEASGKTYAGIMQGYLFQYKSDDKNGTRNDPNLIYYSREKLLKFHITLP